MLKIKLDMPEWEIENLLAFSARPGFASIEVSQKVVDEYLSELHAFGIKSIFCLLDDEELEFYENLPNGLIQHYRNADFNIIHIPIPDPAFHPQGLTVLKSKLDEMWQAYQQSPKPVLIHCSMGVCRTGFALQYIQNSYRNSNDGKQ